MQQQAASIAGFGVANRQPTLSAAAAHLQVDAVELIKARPCTTGRQALEKLGHGDVVQRVTVHTHMHNAQKVDGSALAACGRLLPF